MQCNIQLSLNQSSTKTSLDTEQINVLKGTSHGVAATPCRENSGTGRRYAGLVS